MFTPAFLIRWAALGDADRRKVLEHLSHPHFDQWIANWHAHWQSKGLTVMAEGDDDWFAQSCKRCLDDSLWDFPGGDVLRWLTCSSLVGNGCLP